MVRLTSVMDLCLLVYNTLLLDTQYCKELLAWYVLGDGGSKYMHALMHVHVVKLACTRQQISTCWVVGEDKK